jgi:hypothetical protein
MNSNKKKTKKRSDIYRSIKFLFKDFSVKKEGYYSNNILFPRN